MPNEDRQTQSLPLTSALSDQEMLDAFKAAAAAPLWQMAYALHRQSVLDWHAHFVARMQRPPDAQELHGFLIGECHPNRVEDYLRRAALPPDATTLPTKAMTPGLLGVDKTPIPWRAIGLKFGLLLLAIVVTALFLRQFVPVS